MEINNPFYIEVLKNLNKNKVEYILIGGLAVSYHGYSRYTGDMDLWIKPENENLIKLYKTLIEIGYPEQLILEIRKSRNVDDPTPIKLKDDQQHLKIDLMTNTFQNDYSWQDCFDNSSVIRLNEVSIPVVHINHLIHMKENSKRLDSSMKDLVDAQELKKIKALKDNKSSK